MPHWLYRIKDMPADTTAIEIDYLPEDIEDGDPVLVFVAGELTLIGKYHKEGKALWRDEELQVDLREFYGKLSFAQEKGPRAYKVFAKKVRQITEEDFILLTHRT